MGHAIAEVAQGRDRVAAADRVVADVEADPDHARVEAGDEAVDLGRRLDERPGVRVEGGPTAGRDDLGRQRCGPSPGRRPSRHRSSRGVPGSSARPAADIAVGRAVERDARAPRRRRRGGGAPARGRSASASLGRSVDRGRDRQRRPRPGGGRARREPRAAPRPRGSRCRAGCPRSRSGRSRRGSSAASVPWRRSARSTLFQRIGTVPIDAPGSGIAGSSQGRRGGRAGRPTIPGDGRSSVLLLGHAGLPARALLGMVFRARGVPPARLVGSGGLEIAVDRHVDQRRAAGRQRPTDRGRDLRRVVDALAVEAEGRVRCRRSRASRASRPASGNRSRPNARRTSPGRP